MSEKIWFVSDTHWGHERILKFCPNTRLGSTVEEHDRILIENWQRQVQPGDRVYMLGDCFFSDSKRARSIMDQLPGQKHLVYGNHDKPIQNDRLLQSKFASIDDYKEIRIEGQKVIMFHFPQLEWNQMNHGAFCLFGHVHGSMDTHPMVTNGRTMDVGIDARPDGECQTDGPMTLWGWDQVQRILSKRPIRRHHNN